MLPISTVWLCFSITLGFVPDTHPTLPSREMPISFCVSAMNSMGKSIGQLEATLDSVETRFNGRNIPVIDVLTEF